MSNTPDSKRPATQKCSFIGCTTQIPLGDEACAECLDKLDQMIFEMRAEEYAKQSTN